MEEPTQVITVQTSPYEIEIVERLVRMETKLDHTIGTSTTLESRIAGLEKSIPDPDHELRIRKLERAIWIAAGAATVGGGVVGNLVSQLTGV